MTDEEIAREASEIIHDSAKNTSVKWKSKIILAAIKKAIAEKNKRDFYPVGQQ